VARLVLLLVAVAILTMASTAAGSDTAPPTKPTGRAGLNIVETDPVTLAGRAFKARERVRLSVDGRRKSVTASARGSFRVVFPEANACNGFVAVARGSAGSHASVAFAQFSNVHCLEPSSAG
jgi:hypothetical protein